MANRSRRKNSPAVQARVLKARFPDAHVQVERSRLTWNGILQPAGYSRPYRVRITFKTGEYPKVKVLSHLEGRQGEPLPHVYADGALCLFVEGEWTSDMFIADTIVPWTSEWLLYYELWLFTGEWHGEGRELADSRCSESALTSK